MFVGLMGVTVVDVTLFDANPPTLMLAMLCALMGSSVLSLGRCR
jgi:hypothetical protein